MVISWEKKVALLGLASVVCCIAAAHYTASRVANVEEAFLGAPASLPAKAASKNTGYNSHCVFRGSDFPIGLEYPSGVSDWEIGPTKEQDAIGNLYLLTPTNGEESAGMPAFSEAAAPFFPEDTPEVFPFQTRNPENVEAPAAPAPEGEGVPKASDVERLREEVTALRGDLRGLQETLDHLINRVMASLEEENTSLKQELKHFYVLQEQQGVAPLPGLTPRPYSEVFDALREEARAENPVTMESAGEAAPPLDTQENSVSAPVERPVPAGPFSFTPMKEWGRTADQAATLGKDVASLKGVVGVVPEGSVREDLERLGRDLRKQYEGFDNVNIEVFDTEEAATQYLEQGRTDAAHRVLSVSRHRQSGRDVILYLGGGVDEPVPLDEPGNAGKP